MTYYAFSNPIGGLARTSSGIWIWSCRQGQGQEASIPQGALIIIEESKNQTIEIAGHQADHFQEQAQVCCSRWGQKVDKGGI